MVRRAAASRTILIRPRSGVGRGAGRGLPAFPRRAGRGATRGSAASGLTRGMAARGSVGRSFLFTPGPAVVSRGVGVKGNEMVEASVPEPDKPGADLRS